MLPLHGTLVAAALREIYALADRFLYVGPGSPPLCRILVVFSYMGRLSPQLVASATWDLDRLRYGTLVAFAMEPWSSLLWDLSRLRYGTLFISAMGP